jgi:hypothetical protein
MVGGNAIFTRFRLMLMVYNSAAAHSVTLPE